MAIDPMTWEQKLEMEVEFRKEEAKDDVALLVLLREYGIVAVVGLASGGDDDGTVVNVGFVDIDGLVSIGHPVYEQEVNVMDAFSAMKGGNPLSIPRHAKLIKEVAMQMAARKLHSCDPLYGTGRNCDDSFVLPVPEEGEEIRMHFGSGYMQEDAEYFISHIPLAVVP